MSNRFEHVTPYVTSKSDWFVLMEFDCAFFTLLLVAQCAKVAESCQIPTTELRLRSAASI